ncbi:MAG: proline racemase family protein [Planctomycetota bacterium]
MSRTIRVIDTHTCGEPTRVVVAGGPALGVGTVAEKLERLARHDTFRKSVLDEPRGSDHLVGALICESDRDDCDAGVIFMNNAGYLGMCGHGLIGVAEVLAVTGRLAAGRCRIETPVGPVAFERLADGAVRFENVPSYRWLADVEVAVAWDGEIAPVRGDVAWGGNWFFLVREHGETISRSRVGRLAKFAGEIRTALEREGVTGREGRPVDHVELFGPPLDPHNDSLNFVLCPGGAYDRSPCGTGTSAKLACLAADGLVTAGQTWRQEGITGGFFEASYDTIEEVEWPPPSHRVDLEEAGGMAVATEAVVSVVPRIRGRAYVVAETTLILDPRDPLTTVAWS